MEKNTLNSFCITAGKLSELGLEIGPSGNLSYRNGSKIVITPTGSLFADITLDKLSIYDMQSGEINGAKPSSDLHAHESIYQARNNIQAIVHTHTHYTTLLAMLGQDIPVHNTMHADYFGQTIKCVPFANHRQEGYGNSKHFVDGTAFLLGKHGGLLLFNHNDSEKIAATMKVFSEIAKLYYEFIVGASTLSIAHVPLPQEDVNMINNYYTAQYGEQKV
jgi:ribulose-5-phosphate 4-epimerase/fuculose-1-phosphate aldolase